VLWGSSRPSYVFSLVYSVEGNLWATGTKEQAAVRALHDQYSARLKEEAKRLLYVGMTRARHRLCLMPTGNNYILRDALEPYLADESIHVRRGTIPDVE
jgi:ATP-dependent exoDNAse (exonuclease V) beta subunit